MCERMCEVVYERQLRDGLGQDQCICLVLGSKSWVNQHATGGGAR
jgi:hypothetical protein